MIWAKKRFEVFKRDGFRCQYCWKCSKDVTLEIDHIIPQANWGNDDFNNLITACRECNMGKWKEELDSKDSTFKIKVNDLVERIKKTFYSIWNDWVKRENQKYQKNFDWTLDTKTMWLLASFLQRWVDTLIYDKEWLRREVHEVAINCAFNQIPMNPSVYELYDNPNNPELLKEKLDEFYRGWDFFDGITQFFEQAFILRDCPIAEDIFDDNKWGDLKTLNERLNYNLTLNIKEFKVPAWIIKKYSLFPNAKFEC